MSVIYQRAWNWYSREAVQTSLLEVAKSREVVCVHSNGRFGKRPDIIQYPSDILQALAEGSIAFHGSVERWNQPMKLEPGMMKQDLDSLRIGWDLLLDVDVKDFDIAKIATKQIIEALKDHGVQNYSCKYTGGSSFHIGVPFESLPEKINLQPTAGMYPELLQKIIGYIKWYIRDQLREEILGLDTPINIAKRVKKPLNEIIGEDGIEPFKIITMDVFGSRHLIRLPYSLHEKSLLVSLPIKPADVDKFQKEDALPEKIRNIDERFLIPKVALHDAEALAVEALDWAVKHKIKTMEELPRPKTFRKMRKFTEDFFPPCIGTIMKGLPDGKKRSLFILINFLRNVGWSTTELEKRLVDWNEKNSPPMRASYVRGQLRWGLRQERNMLPPNCDNENFYRNIGVCKPDEHCKNIKNPINYPFRKLKSQTRTIRTKP